ncbi:type II secretion system protein N [Pacificimonas sp. ICDLI1SI03]
MGGGILNSVGARIGIFVVVMLAALVGTLPLASALDGADLPPATLRAQAAKGSIWNGTLVNATLFGVQVGDIDIAAAPTRLLTGRPALRFSTPEGSALSLSGYGGGGGELAGLSGSVDLSSLFPSGPLTGSATFTNISVARDDGMSCSAASGTIEADVGVNVPGLPSGGTRSFIGPVACENGQILADLASGNDHLLLTIAGDRPSPVMVMVGGASFALAPNAD